SIKQTIRLRENETTMVMGIRQPQVSSSLNGWPGVSSIPGLGYLGADKTKMNQDSDLIVLITPRMVELAPRKDHMIYAGRGAPEGQGGAFGARGIDRDRGAPPPPAEETPQPQRQPQPFPRPQPQPQPQPEPE